MRKLKFIHRVEKDYNLFGLGRTLVETSIDLRRDFVISKEYSDKERIEMAEKINESKIYRYLYDEIRDELINIYETANRGIDVSTMVLELVNKIEDSQK